MNTADLNSLSNTPTLKPLRFQMLADLPVRAKLLLAFLAITAVSASMIAFFSARTTSANLTETVGATLKNAATQNGLAVGNALERQVAALKAFSLDKALKDGVEKWVTRPVVKLDGADAFRFRHGEGCVEATPTQRIPMSLRERLLPNTIRPH